MHSLFALFYITTSHQQRGKKKECFCKPYPLKVKVVFNGDDFMRSGGNFVI